MKKKSDNPRQYRIQLRVAEEQNAVHAIVRGEPLQGRGVDTLPNIVRMKNYRTRPWSTKMLGKFQRLTNLIYKHLDAIEKSPVGKVAKSRAFKSLPVIPFFYTLFGPGEASAAPDGTSALHGEISTAERIARAVAGEIGIGPFDLEFTYDYFLVPTVQIFRDFNQLGNNNWGIPPASAW